MIASPVTLRKTLLAGFCVSALVMAACSGGDKPVAEEITVDAPSLELTSADETALSRHFAIRPRSGSEADTLALLAALELGDGADIEATRVIDGSTVTYTDWRTTDEDSVFTADTMTLTGLHELDGRPTFDKMVISNLKAEEFEEEAGVRDKVADASVDELIIVGPSPDMAQSLAQLVRGEDGADLRDSDAANDITVEGSFRAMRLDNLVVDVTEDGNAGKATIKQIVVGNDIDDERMDLVVETVDFDWDGDAAGSEGLTLKMDGLTALGLDTSKGKDFSMGGLGMFGNIAATMSPTARLPYRQIDLGKLDMKMAMFELTTDGFEADSETKGDETTLRSVLSPMVLTLKDATGTPFAPYMEALSENGLDEITMRGSQTMTLNSKTDRMVISDARMEFDEGLRTRCDYAIQGTNAAARALEASGIEPPVLDLDDEATRDADLDAYFEQVEAYGLAQAEANKLIKIESLDCDIQDIPGNSLVERGYKVAAEITGKPVAVLKGGAKTMIALGSLTASSEFERDLMDTVGTGLIDFIDAPGQTLSITMSPEVPVSITALTGEAGTEPSIKPLGLEVEVR